MNESSKKMQRGVRQATELRYFFCSVTKQTTSDKSANVHPSHQTFKETAAMQGEKVRDVWQNISVSQRMLKNVVFFALGYQKQEREDFWTIF